MHGGGGARRGRGYAALINRPEEGGRGCCLLRSLDKLEAPRQLLLKAAADYSRWGEGTARFLTYREQQAAIQVTKPAHRH